MTLSPASELSYGQRRMWLLSELSHGAAALNLVMAVRLSGRLNVAALRQAFDDVSARHEVLRVVIAMRDGRPVQLPGPHRRLPLHVVDLSALPAAVAAQRAHALLREHTARPFDLAAGPLGRLTLLTVGPAEHLLAVAMHHVITDGWSMTLLAAEVSALYRAYLHGRPGPLSGKPAVQYRDFVRWQRELVETGPDPGAALARLRDLTGGGLPLDRPPAARRHRAAATSTVVLPPAVVLRLGQLRRAAGGSLFMLVLAALLAVIHRVGGRSDVAVGTFSAGRTRPEFEPVLGYFVNVLVVRASFTATSTFRQVWDQVREQCVAAYAEQELPYEKLIELLRPERSAQLAPPVSVLCAMRQPPPVLHLPGLSVEAVDVPHAAARFELTVEVREHAGLVELALQYDTDVLDAATVDRMGRYLREVLTAAAADPDLRCARLLGQPAARPVVVPAVDGTVHGLFERQAARTPDAVALVHGDTVLSYRVLNERANRLARRLVAAGVGVDDRVAVQLPRSLAAVIAVLAVLKAGAGYLPLDPRTPQRRRAELLADAGPVHLLTDLLTDAGAPDDLAATDLGRPVSPDNLAYLLYTSGSTGAPKGVLGTHAGLLNRLRWAWRAHPYRPGERAAHRTSLGFVDSVTELFGPLLAGVPVHVLDDADVLDPERLITLLGSRGITRLVVVPSLLRMLLDAVPDPGAGLAPRGLWVSSGERLPPELAARFHAALPGYELLNLYGCTEIAGDATAALVPPGAPAVTIGCPIDGLSATVVERGGCPVPPLVPGELWIGGAGVARGYHARAALTAARFGPDPAGGRAFRTGDLARVAADGQLRHLGRLDGQLTVRGVRVEPGEVEDALRRHPAVAQAAVTTWPDAAGTATLIGYVVAQDQHQEDQCRPGELLAFLRERLPPHLVPSAVLTVAQLPHTPSGKIDRARLPAPQPASVSVSASAQVAPAGAAQRAVAEVFAELLPVRWRGVDDDFFALGGHSILAIAAVHRLRERCGVELGLGDVFAARTIAGLAERIDRAQPNDPAPPAPVFTADQQYEPFPLTEVQQAYWVGRDGGLDLGAVATHAYFEVHAAELDPARLQHALRRLVHRHPALRTVIRPDGYQQVLREVPAYQLPVLRPATEADAERVHAALREELSHQVLAGWPLFDLRACLLPGGGARLHVSIDALIADAHSVHLLMDELAALYHDPAHPLPPLALTFRDCVLAAQARRNGPAYERDLHYWRRRLPELALGPQLPLARQPATVARPRFRRWSATLSAQRWARLRRRAADAGLTPPAVLLAVFAEVLTAWSAHPHYTLTLTLFDREPDHPDAASVVGDFTSLTLLEIDHREPATFGERAARLQRQLWEDLDHRLVSGVTVLREWTRARGGRPQLLAPVVFTSNLGGRAPSGSPPLGELGFALTQTPQLYLDYQVADGPDGLSTSWDVVAELFPAGLVEDLHAAHSELLTALADGSIDWNAEVPPLLPARQLRARSAANATTRPRSPARLHTLVGDAARRHPQATAVIATDRRLSYQELAERAGRIGRRLRALGVRRGEPVGVLAGKGWAQIVAVLGVSVSGAAYVPLDPDLPPARLRLLAERTGLRHTLVTAGLAARAPVPALVVDDESAWLDWPPHWPDEPAGRPGSDLAYLVHTSGSTGEPKAVMIDHGAAVNTITDLNRRFAVGPGDRVLGLSALSFDLSVYDIFGVLGAGGALVLPDPARLRDPGHWAQLVHRERVTLWNSVPALLALVAERPDEGLLRGLRLVLLSGDWIGLDLPGRVHRLAPQAEVVSLGGATEASIWSVHHPADRIEPGWTSVPYGRPLTNQRAHVLDGRLRPCPDWVPGELYLAGDGLAAGYWGDPQATARAFPVHPLTGERLYRTGDLARYRPGATLELLGRTDRQVKINGMRVELGEVESALAAVPGVSAAAVIAAGPARGEKRLVACYVAAAGAAADPPWLRQRLAQVLPAHLVPGVCIPLPALPLTGNGKIDTAALRGLADSARGAGGTQAAAGTAAVVDGPDTGVLDELARLWAAVLGVPQVGPHDNFFELGGTSLVAVRLLTRLRDERGATVTLTRLYEAPTVAGMAADLAVAGMATDLAAFGASPGTGGGVPAVTGQASALVTDLAPRRAGPAQRHEPFALTAVQQAYWLGRRPGLDLGGVATRSYLELDVHGLDVDRLQRAVRALVARHDALRTVVLADGRQRVLPHVPPYRVGRTDLRGDPQAPDRLARLRERLSHRVRPADRWPLFDLRATQLDGGRTRLHVGLDLLVADALSFQILRGELLRCYAGGVSALPAPPGCTFRDYVLAADRLADTPAGHRARQYWTARLAELPAAPPLPRLHPHTTAAPRFRRLHGRLDPQDWQRLIALAARRNLTPSGLLCAAFAEVLALWSQCGRFTLNLTTFNRQPLHPDVDAVIGDFTSTTLLAVDAAAATFAQRAVALQRQIFRDLDHREFSGVDALRLLRADPARRADAMAPVVFTSLLMPAPPAGASAGPAADEPVWSAEPVFSVSQTPQVLLDHQVYEHAGTLAYTWDYVAEQFPPGMVEAMLDGYGRLLRSLHTDGTYWEAAPGWTM